MKRDEHNRLDRNDAKAKTEELMQKLITEERMFQKDISFNHARGNKRDIMVYMTIFARNSVDGMIVVGDEGNGFVELDRTGHDPYRYKDLDFIEFPIMAKDMPMSKETMGQAIKGFFTHLVSKLIRIGAIDK